MNNIQIMINEHIKIARMLDVIKIICKDIFETKNVDIDDINKIIDFIQNYADKHHHEKEENYLFKEMIEHLGHNGKNLITHGMLVEHNFARLYLSMLQKAVCQVKTDDYAKIDIIANLVSYGNLLSLHIQKEDNVIYNFGYKNLPKDIADKVDKTVLEIYNSPASIAIEEKYEKVICELETKYME